MLLCAACVNKSLRMKHATATLVLGGTALELQIELVSKHMNESHNAVVI